MEKDDIFRKVALDRLASPEQLDAMVRVIPANAWFALSAVGLIISFALVWGWFGSIPTTVSAQAIIINRSGLVTVSSNADGRLTEMLVRVGDQVEIDQPVARIAQPDLQLELSKAEAELLELREQLAATTALNERSDALTAAAIAEKRAALESERDAALENAEVSRELSEAKNSLWQRKLITQTVYLEAYRDYTESRLRAETVASQISELDIDQLETEKRNRAEIVDLETRISATERAIAGLEDQIERNSVMTSPYAGRVVEVKAARGALTGIGEPLVTLEEDADRADRLEVVIYPTTADGKKIAPGMEARITPTTVKREESGYMLGRIRTVSDYTVSEASMLQQLQSQALVEQFFSLAPPLEVHADLQIRADGADFLWSSTANEPPLISSGTLAEAEIVVRRQRPITLVVPILKKTLGLD